MVFPYLNAEQEKGEVEVNPRQNVFVRDRHENGGAAVRKDSGDGTLC
jgi:hypothetical protein